MLILILSRYKLPILYCRTQGPPAYPSCYSPPDPCCSSGVLPGGFPCVLCPLFHSFSWARLEPVHPSLWLTSLLTFHQWDTSSSLILPRLIHQINNLDRGFCLLNSHTLPLDYHWTAVIDYLHLGLHGLCWSSAAQLPSLKSAKSFKFELMS